MARKSAPKRSRNAVFVQAVSDLYQFHVNNRPVSQAYAALSASDQLDARSVATGLVAIINYMGHGHDSPMNRVQQAWYSLHLFDALTAGTPGPYLRYFSNLKGAKLGRPKAGIGSERRRSYFVGMVNALKLAALMDRAKRSRAQNVKIACKVCQFDDQTYSDYAVGKWIERGRAEEAAKWAQEILQMAAQSDRGSFTSRVEASGRLLIATLEAEPAPLPFE
jgi:hypothetical protein